MKSATVAKKLTPIEKLSSQTKSLAELVEKMNNGQNTPEKVKKLIHELQTLIIDVEVFSTKQKLKKGGNHGEEKN